MIGMPLQQGRVDHLVNAIRWDGICDSLEAGNRVQPFISDWSNEYLPSLLDDVFDRHFGDEQTWRIDRLVVDLGAIEIDDLESQLPDRLRDSLHHMLDDLLRRRKVRTLGESSVEAVDDAASALSQVREFLTRGSLPWWCRSGESHQSAVSRLFLESPMVLVDTVRTLARQQTVRRRLVWQWSESQLALLLKSLEPANYEYILEFSRRMSGLMSSAPNIATSTRAFRDERWLWTLTYLLAEQETVFGPANFVKSMLTQMANHYRIDFDVLFQQLAAAGSRTGVLGSGHSMFRQAISSLQDEQKTASPNVASQDDIWLRWRAFTDALRSGSVRTKLNGLLVRVAELLSTLAIDDPKRMVSVLRQQGRKPAVREALIRNFRIEELEAVVELVAPRDATFINAHARRIRFVVTEQNVDADIVWDVVLAYVLRADGSHFNRRQFVRATLQGISESRNMAYSELLLLLQHSASNRGYGHRFEFSQILLELQIEQDQLQPRLAPEKRMYGRALTAYLKDRADNEHPTSKAALNYFLIHDQQGLADLIAVMRHSRGSPATRILATRLFDITGSSVFEDLLDSLSAGSAPFLLATIGEIRAGVHNGTLVSMRDVDVSYHLHQMVVAALLVVGRRFTITAFMDAMLRLMRQWHSIDIEQWRGEFSACVSRSSPSRHQRLFQSWLTDQSTAATETSLQVEARADTAHSVEAANRPQAPASSVEDRKKWQTLIYKFLLEGRWPLWAKASFGDDVSAMMDRVLTTSPDAVRTLIAPIAMKPCVAYRLLDSINYAALLRAISGRADARQVRQLEEIHSLLGRMAPRGISSNQLRRVLLEKTLDWWLSDAIDRNRIPLPIEETISYMGSNAIMPYDDFRRWLQQQSMSVEVRTALNSIVDTLPQSYSRSATQDAAIDAMTPRAETPITVSDTSVAVPKTKLNADVAQIHDVAKRTKTLAMKEQDDKECQKLIRDYLLEGKWSQRAMIEFSGDVSVLIRKALTTSPEMMRSLLAQVFYDHRAVFRFLNCMNYGNLLQVITGWAGAGPVRQLEETFSLLSRLTLRGVTPRRLERVLLEKTLDWWLGDARDSSKIPVPITELIAYLVTIERITLDDLRDWLSRQSMSAETRTLLNAVLTASHVPSLPAETNDIAIPAMIRGAESPQADSGASDIRRILSVNNAGIVLCQDFLPTYFNRLDLLKDGSFVSPSAQRRATHCLQYLATGRTQTEENYLSLNKILCGLDLAAPVERGIALNESEIEIANSLIQAMIGYWEAIRTSSIDGFRGNWLVRDGTLIDSEDDWSLVVDKKGYDVLLGRAPFSYSLVNFSWMTKPIHVTWVA